MIIVVRLLAESVNEAAWITLAMKLPSKVPSRPEHLATAAGPEKRASKTLLSPVGCPELRRKLLRLNSAHVVHQGITLTPRPVG